MKPWCVIVSVLVLGLSAGCASDTDLQAVQTNTATIERQTVERHQTVETRLQRLQDLVTQAEQTQNETRRGIARVNATMDEVRIQLQRLKGDMQETQRRVQRGTTSNEGVPAGRLADFETRLRELEKQLNAPASPVP